jgi:predicted nucleotide-binding protein (sugar kinase/HSP70/actin superfamily)
MRITFPYMGHSHWVFRQLLSELGHEPIVPPSPTKRTLDYGTRYSPEFACIPFKVLLGSYLEAIELGAEAVVTTGGVGPCRAGYYAPLHQRILADLGYKIDFIVLEPPLRNVKEFYRQLRKLIPPGIGIGNLLSILHRAWVKLNAIDHLERLSHQIRPRELERGRTTRVFRKCLELIGAARTVSEINAAREEGVRLLTEISIDREKELLKIGIIGEIYVVLEPFINHNVQILLEGMGVLADRSIYLADWVRGNALVPGEKDIKRAARPYLKELVGGHGLNSIGETVLYAQRGFDGVVQLAPFACIPEIVAKSIIPSVSRKLGIPVLTLFLDEQTGEAGIKTRLEAFVDLLLQKKRKGAGAQWNQVTWA